VPHAAWGDSSFGGKDLPAGEDVPAGSGYTKIYSTWSAFAAPHTLIDPSALRAAKAPLVE
jgi:hypothetical protein